MDRLVAAKVFLDVSKTGSFTASADRLNMSRPMVTRYVESMESWLNARLFHRTTRKVTLTHVGESCLEQVEAWVSQAEALSVISQIDTELSGNIKITAATSLATSQLIPAFASFMQRHPKVSIELDAQDVTADLIHDQIDIAVRISSSPSGSLIGKPIASCLSALVASPDYIDRKDAIKSASDLTAHQALGYKNFGEQIWHLSKGESIESIKANCMFTTNEVLSLKQAVLSGMGIAMLPTYLVNDDIKRNALTQVLPEWTLPTMQIYVLYSSRKFQSPAVRALIDFLSDYFKDNPWD
ncbi:LysR family transcriptional regulator [Thalassotalea euphylliae]|uniref:LysR family transcriptional regulator n=1 Tax=Thalassotalea euphylliae TaxID=1655234 RepID=UPI003628A9A2